MTPTKPNYSPDEIAALRQKVKDYQTSTKKTWDQIAGAIGIGKSTLTALVNDTYNGNIQGQWAEIDVWFRSSEALELFVGVENIPGYLPLPTSLAIRDNLTWAKRGNMTTCITAPGIGKTMEVKRFQNDFSNVYVLTASPSNRSLNALLVDMLRAMGSAIGNRNAHDLSYSARRQCLAREKPLLIIDEAQHMGELALEEVRAIHDQTRVGVAFFGNPNLTNTIDGTRTAQFAQRSSRITMRDNFLTPQEGDITILLGAWGIDREVDGRDNPDFAFMRAIGMRPGGGALRQMTAVLDLATFLARGRKQPRNITHIKLASDQLDAGVA